MNGSSELSEVNIVENCVNREKSVNIQILFEKLVFENITKKEVPLCLRNELISLFSTTYNKTDAKMNN